VIGDGDGNGEGDDEYEVVDDTEVANSKGESWWAIIRIAMLWLLIFGLFSWEV